LSIENRFIKPSKEEKFYCLYLVPAGKVNVAELNYLYW